MTADALSLFHGLVASLNPEEAAKHSMLDHHAVGLDYVNLLRTDRLTVKLYVIEPNRIRCAEPEQRWVVYPHDHAYDFDTHVLAGRVDNITFGPGAMWPCDQWTYNTRTRAVHRASRASLKEESRTIHTHGSSYALGQRTIHTISVSRTAVTVMLLLQYADLRTKTSLFGPSLGAAPSFEGLYRKPMPADVERLVARANEAIS